MSETFVFRPAQRRGLMFHIIVVVALATTSAFLLFIGLDQPVGSSFVLLLILSLVLFAPVPLVIYRGYSLTRASYRLERDGLRLRWGLRAEDIPLPNIEWVRRSTDLAGDLPLPRLCWPGAIVGTVNVPDLGSVEFMAGTTDPLLLIATAGRVYAISPADSDGFLHAFERSLEMGSLSPLNSVSVLPAAYLTQILRDRAARSLLISGLVLILLLFIGVSLTIPGQIASAPESSAQILLLPILGTFIYVADLATGLFFYRRIERRLIAYLLWGGGIVTILLLMLAAARVP